MNIYDDGKITLSCLQNYLNKSINREEPVINQKSIEEINRVLNLEDHIQKGDLSGQMLESFIKKYLTFTTRLHHPRYMAHQVSVPTQTAAMGSLIEGVTNNPMSIYEMGPGAAAIEFFMVNYLLKKMDWTPMPLRVEERLTFQHGSGLLTHGGSLANLTALLTAKNNIDPSLKQRGVSNDYVILAPDSSHYSISKAAGIMGIGENNVVKLETDDLGRIQIEKLDPVYQKTIQENKKIIALVANGCSTGTGLYDDIDKIADFCNSKDIWFHIDGAHGGSAIFSKKGKSFLNGIQKADSIIIDAHKMLRTPVVCAALLVKNAPPLEYVFEQKASYLFHEKNQPGFDFIGQSFECTKAGLGLRFFFTLAGLGEKGIEDYLNRQFDLTQKAYEYIKEQPEFECPYRPESNILCFRINASDETQLAIRDMLIEEGSYYISSTQLMERRYLRISLMNPDTTIEDIKGLVNSIIEKFALLKR